MIGGEAIRAEQGVLHRPVVPLVSDDSLCRHWVDVFPNQVTGSCDFKEVSFGRIADQRIAVRQALDAGVEVAEHALVCHRVIHPGNLPRHGFGALVSVVPRRCPVVVTGGGRIHIRPCVVGARIQVAVDFENVGLRRSLEQVASVVVHQEMARARQSGGNPLRVTRSADLFVPRGASRPVLLDRRGIALAIARRVAKAVEEVAIRAGSQRDASRRIAGEERVAMTNHIELASRRVDHDLAEVRVVINRVAMQPVVGHGPARQIEIQSARVVGNAPARADVVGFACIKVLDAVVKETPLPHHVPGHVHLHNRVHLGVGIGTVGRIASRRDTLVGRDRPGGDVKRRIRAELGVVDPQEIMVWQVVGACFRVLPDRVPTPVHLLESGEAVDIAADSVEHVAVREQVRIRPDRPRVSDPSLHVNQIGVALHAEERVAAVSVGLVPIEHLCRTLQPLVGVHWN